MVKLIIFDLDGVLVNAKEIHYKALNLALNEIDANYVISLEEHLSTYDGLKTSKKLELLTKNKGLPKELHDKVWHRKQEYTLTEIDKLQKDERLVDLFANLRKQKFMIACCSNSIRRSVYVMLSKIGVIEYFDVIISNEDVQNSKPHPEIYSKAMKTLGVLPEETLVVEDSPNGLLGAHRSYANVLRVKSPEFLTIDKIESKLKEVELNPKQIKWDGQDLNILIPMAGAGSRFVNAGYKLPKPLIDVNGKPMIKVAIDSLNINANYIFIIQKEHRENYQLDTFLNLIEPKSKIIEIDSVTEGAACTTLLAKELINNDNPLLIANCDQYITWDSFEFMYLMNEQNLDGGILTFRADSPKWSYVRTDENGYVKEVAEKTPISDKATVGVYYWAKGCNYVKCAESMIKKDIRVNGEFYVCPVYNESILNGDKIKSFDVGKMYGLGTPEDLDKFLTKVNK